MLAAHCQSQPPTAGNCSVWQARRPAVAPATTAASRGCAAAAAHPPSLWATARLPQLLNAAMDSSFSSGKACWRPGGSGGTLRRWRRRPARWRARASRRRCRTCAASCARLAPCWRPTAPCWQQPAFSWCWQRPASWPCRTTSPPRCSAQPRQALAPKGEQRRFYWGGAKPPAHAADRACCCSAGQCPRAHPVAA